MERRVVVYRARTAVSLVAVLLVLSPGLMAQANVQGQWTTLTPLMPINPVHVALLRTGKVLLVSGSGNLAGNLDWEAGIWDPQTGTTATQPLSWDMFCNGMVVLPDGRVFINGGTLQYDPFRGEPKSSIYDPLNNTFTTVQNMAHGRWYPTVTSLGDGRVMAFSGLNDTTGATNLAVELYTVGSGWSSEFAAPFTPPLYPRMHLLPNGKVLYSGSGTNSSLFDPSTKNWTTNIATTKFSGTRTYGTSVLLPLTPANNYNARVMILGGGNPATATTEIIDTGAPTPSWQFGPNMSRGRIEMNAVILPNGKVLALGGSSSDEDESTASLNADLYDPVANTFFPAGANVVPRVYHSVALLLPDATVWLAGGNPTRGNYKQQMEIYQPAYLFTVNGSGNVVPAVRPTISGAPASIRYGNAFTVQTPDSADISSAVLVRPGAATHAFDMDQRLVGLSFTRDVGALNLMPPPNGNIAPPGYYMLFLLNSAGVPSVARFIQVSSNSAPLVTTISPVSGTTSGGTAVTITGTGFLTGASVSLGGTAATGVNVVGPSSITATTPVHAGGTVNVVVTNNDGQSGTLANGYTYVSSNPAPTVNAISPTSGTTAGGTTVAITGTGFLPNATVNLGGVSATNVNVLGSTSITATTPAHAAGAVSVVVTNTDGKNGTLANGFTYILSATLGFAQVAAATPQSPASAVSATYPAAQGAGDLNVVVVGWNDATSNVTNVSDTQGNVYSLAIGPTRGTALSQSIYYARNIKSGNNTVTVNFNQAAAFVDLRILEYTGLDPVSPLDVTAGGSGSSVTPSSGSATTNSVTELIFGANTVWTTNSAAGTNFTVRIITTPDSDLAEDRIVNALATYSAMSTLSSSGPWVMQMATFRAAGQAPSPAPMVSSISPTSGTTAGGNSVNLTGSGFLAGATVQIGGTAATGVNVVGTGSITAIAPAHAAGAASVAVTNTDGQSGMLANGYSYVAPNPAPTVTAILPNSGTTAGGTAVTITGTGFLAGASVRLGGTAATGVNVVGPSSITATAPAHAAGAANVVVTNTDSQSGTLTNGYTYVNPAPTVASVSPTGGTTAGSTAVTITGTGFLAGASVSFSGSVATSINVANSTSITATTPAHTAGAVDVVVTNSDTRSGTLTNGYTYSPAPTVTAISPASGTTAGGTAVNITGTGFLAGASVNIGGTAATGVNVAGPTSITATAPAHAAGAVNVMVTNSDGQGGTLANGYTYVSSNPAPTVTAISPASGTTAGGTVVNITGTGVLASATVSFGGTAATGVTVAGSTSITATTPAHAAGAVSVVVTNTDGKSGTLTNGFTYTSVSPSISFVQVAAATPQSPALTVAVTYPTPQLADSLNIVVIGWNDTTATVQQVRDSAGNIYSLAIGPTSGIGLRQSIYYASHIVGSSNTVTVTFSQAAAFADVRILEYRGVSTLDVTAGASGNSAAPSSGTGIMTTAANELIFGANTVATLTSAAGSGFATRIITNPDGDIAEDRIVTTIGAYSAAAPLISAGPWVMQMATFK